LRMRRLRRASASHAAKPTNQIHAVFRIIAHAPEKSCCQVEQPAFDDLVLHY
jgi:hypothetical protein